MDTLNLGFALLAGLTSILSPCVLPLAPVVVGTALSKHRYGSAALAAGLALSFTAIGLFVATIGFSLGLDDSVFRVGGATLLVAVGIVLLVPRLQSQFALAAGPVSDWTERQFNGHATDGWSGQFAVGLLLGAVWTPCVGPTMGAAITMAAQGRDLVHVASTMFVFSVGSALPLIVLGLLSRSALAHWRGKLVSARTVGKIVLGVVLIANGALILFGLDKAIEAAVVGSLPMWLLEAITRY